MCFTTDEYCAAAGRALLADLRLLGRAGTTPGPTEPADIYLMALTSFGQLVASTGEQDTRMIFATEEFDGIPEALAVLATHVPGTTAVFSQVHSRGDGHWVDVTVTLPYGTSEPIVATFTCGIYEYPEPDEMFRFAARYEADFPAAATDNADIDMCLAAIHFESYWKLVRWHASTEVRRMKFLKVGIVLEDYAAKPKDDVDWLNEPEDE